MAPLEVSFTYSLPYLFLIAVYFVLSIFEEVSSEKEKYLYISFFVGLFYIGLRGFVFTDWIIYASYFESIPTIFHLSENGNTLNYEIFFYFYASIIKTIYPSYHFFIFIDTAIDLILFSVFLRRYSTNRSLATLIFLVMGGFSFFFNLIRNIKSILLFMVSLRYIDEKRFLPFIILNIIGALFHISSLLFLPVYFIARVKFGRIFFVAVLIAGLILYTLKIDLFRGLLFLVGEVIGGRLGVLIDTYLNNDMYSVQQGFSLGFIEKTGTMICIIALYNRLLARRPDGYVFLNIFLIYFIVYFYFSSIRIIPERVGILYVFPYIILWVDIVLQFCRKDKFLLLICMYFFFLLKGSMYNTIIMRYDNVLFGAQSYEQRLSIFNRSKHLVK